MGTTTTLEVTSAPSTTRAKAAAIPWHVWVAVLSVTCAMVGGHWDVAWHRSIGRDGFWTAPHVVLYLCGVLAAISCGTLIVSATVRGDRHATVRVWGLRGPLGAFIASWGGVTMLTSAPFDDWWHSAYGLDVKILSPPHVLLILGILGVYVGTLLLVLGCLNRAHGDQRVWLERLFLYVAGGIVIALMLMLMEDTNMVEMHGARFYRDVCWSLPIVLVSARVVSKRRWACVSIASVYMAFYLAMLWLMPLVHAEPKLGPVYQHVTHLIPPGFPMWLVIPAALFDLGWQRFSTIGDGRLGALGGATFLITLIAIQWPWASFQMVYGRNAIFGTDYFDYSLPPRSFWARHLFFPSEHSPSEFAVLLALALIGGMLACRLGLLFGRWMARVQR